MRWPIVAAAALLAAGQAGKPVRRQERLPHAAADSRNPLATFIRDRTLDVPNAFLHPPEALRFEQPASDSMFAPVAPHGGVFHRAGFQARNVLPAFAIHTCRTDDVMRSETLTIDVNRYPTIEPVHDIRFQRGWQRRESQANSGETRTDKSLIIVSLISSHGPQVEISAMTYPTGR
jgi:hypothetical protein